MGRYHPPSFPNNRACPARSPICASPAILGQLWLTIGERSGSSACSAPTDSRRIAVGASARQRLRNGFIRKKRTLLTLKHNVGMPLEQFTTWLLSSFRRYPNGATLKAAVVFTVVEVVTELATSSYGKLLSDCEVPLIEQLMHIRAHQNAIGNVVMPTSCYWLDVRGLKHWQDFAAGHCTATLVGL